MSTSPGSRRFLLIISYLGFISLGLPDTVIGVAWPSVRDTFGQEQGAVALIFFGAGLSYFFSSFFTGRLLGVMGIGVLLALSSGLVASSAFGYGAATLWALFAGCALLHGLGSGAIDAGLNHYVAHHFSARHMNWLHACYSLGATLGPLMMTAAITGFSSWRAGYFSVGATLAALALLFAVTHRSWNDPAGAGTSDAESEATPSTPAAPRATMMDALRHPAVWMQVALFFFYTGLEVTVGQWSFTVLTEARGIGKETAGLWVAVYWASICAGRFLLGIFVERIGVDRLLRWSTAAAIFGAAIFAFHFSPLISAAALALTGFGLASIYPCMMTRTPQRLGKDLSAHAIGFQVSTAMLGAAALPSLSGLLASRFGLETIAMAAAIMAAIVWLLHELLLRRDSQVLRSTALTAA